MRETVAVIYANEVSCKKVYFKSTIESQILVCNELGIRNILVVSKDIGVLSQLNDEKAVTYCINGDNDILDLMVAEEFFIRHQFVDCLIFPSVTPFITKSTINKLLSLKDIKAADGVFLIPDRENLYTPYDQQICCINVGEILNAYDTIKKGDVFTVNKLQRQCHMSGRNILYYKTQNDWELTTAESDTDTIELCRIYNRNCINQLIKGGVLFINTDGIIVESTVTVGKGTLILPGSILRGDTEIGEGCVIGPNAVIDSCSIGNNSVINASQCYSSTIEEKVKIGPYCHIRPNSLIKSGVKIGDFVEVKNSVIGEKTSISHLTYVGDSDVGKGVNFGCGVVTVNYDGTNKNRCSIGDHAFIGCNTNLVAPVRIEDGGYTAAGSTITQDVPKDTLAIARSRQVNKIGYAIGRVKRK